MDKLIMSNKEREQIKILEQLAKKKISIKAAAQMLNWTKKWTNKKLERYIAEGDAGIIHKNRGKPSPKKWNTSERTLTIDLLKSEWRGFGPTFVAEKLLELKGIKVSEETIRQMMIQERLWTPGKKSRQYRKMRERKLMIGILVQLDGSPHDWFEGRGPKCTLLVFIDDATSKILWLEFVESESFDGVATAARNYIQKHGRPVAFYVDYGSVFSVNLNNPDREKITQFERIMAILGIEVKHASSPQAKGRVERCNQTMQDRLVKEMRLAGISSIETANEFLRNSTFIEKHNERFAVKPLQEGDAHRSTEGYNLYQVFCTQDERVVTNDYTVRYKGKVVQLAKQQLAIVRPKNRIIVSEHLDKKLTLSIRNIPLNFSEIYVRQTKKLTPIQHVEHEQILDSENCIVIKPPSVLVSNKHRIYRKPAANHPWRNDFKATNKSTTNGGY